LKEAFPRVSRVAVLAQPSLLTPTLASWKALEEAARKLRVTLHPVEIRSPDDLANAFATIIRKGDSAVYVRATAVTVTGRHRIADLALRNRPPSMYDQREFVDAGGLMHYGVNIFALYRRAATYVDKILKGAKAGDLPIEQPTEHPQYGSVLREAEGASRSLGVPLQVVEARGPREYDSAFAAIVRQRAGALLVLPDPVTSLHRRPLLDLAAKYRLPASYGSREFVEAGGLIGYGPSLSGLWRRAAIY
jgi:ABC-type uncharacterized transport system substrate-binding protein